MHARTRRSPCLELLETRSLLAADILFDPSSGVLSVIGTGSADTVIAESRNDTLIVSAMTGREQVSRSIDLNRVSKLRFLGHGGNDLFRNETSLNSEARGGPGNDRLIGGLAIDVFWGDDGNDYLRGNDGDDTLDGGPGRDRIRGGLGDDLIRGGSDNDFLSGDQGDDTLWGGPGNDRLRGYQGDDVIRGESGHDQLHGGGGDDQLRGGDGNDTLFGGPGDDYVFGDAGMDLVLGEAGDDLIKGGSGDDQLHGGSGNDRILAGSGSDIALGEDGNDIIDGGTERDIVIGGSDSDRVNGNRGEDILVGGSTAHDDSPEALQRIRQIWRSSASYEDRVAELQKPSNPSLVPEDTVFDDGVRDDVQGQAGDDLFFLTGQWDQRSGRELADFLTSLDEMDERTADEIVQSRIRHAHSGPMMVEHLALLDLVNYQDVTHTAIASGNWTDAAIWENETPPSDGARVLIPEGISVTVDSVVSARLHTVRVDGSLRFDPTLNTELAVDTLVVTPRGLFEMGTAEAPIATDATARLLILGNRAIDRAWDPFELSRGVIIHGQATIYGAAKSPYATLAQPARQGQRRLVLESEPVNWKPGDRLVLAGTDRNAQHDEEVIVQAISGRAVLLSRALRYSHAPANQRMSVHVANLTRNAVFESESRRFDRAHLMFMHTRNVDVNYAGVYHFGRTNKHRPVNDTVVNDQLEVEPGTGRNQRGRYAVHFHRNGVQNDGSPARVHGSVVTDSHGWGYVNHSSYVEFTANVAYDVAGSSFVTEAGDEIGKFDGNLAIHGVGSGDGIESRRDLQDFAHQGDGFWFQGGGVSVTNNVAAGQSGHGFVFFTRGLVQEGLGTTQFLAENLAKPELARGADLVRVGEVPLLEFRHNEAYGNGTGVATRFHKLRETHDEPSVLEDLRLWHNGRGLHLPYTHNTIVRNVEIIGSPSNPYGVGIGRNGVTRNITYENIVVEGFRYGLQVPERGKNVIVSGRLRNVENIVITTAVRRGREVHILPGVAMETPSNTRNWRPYNIVMRAVFQEHRDSLEHVFYGDTVIWNSPTGSLQLYYQEQAGDFVPFPIAGAYVPANYVGKTNQMLWEEFGKAVAGGLLPEGARAVYGVRGLVK